MRPRVALTFDDGPSEWTPALLDLLAAHDARATFFVLGCNIEGHEWLVKRAAGEGHEFGVHGWDHTKMPSLHTQDLRHRVRRTEVALMAAGAPKPVLWRAPWNDVATDVIRAFDELGYEYAPATLDGFDVSRGAEAIAKTVIPNLEVGAIVGLHDGIAANGEPGFGTREPTIRAVGQILRRCRSVTVSELQSARVLA